MSTSIQKRGLVAALVTVFAVAGCSSTPDFTQEYADRLAASDAALAAGDLARSNGETVRLIDDMEERGIEGYEVQRGVAEALLVAINASASQRNGFLTEPGRFEFSLDASGSGDRSISETAHRIATIFHAWRLLEREPALAGAEPGNEAIAPGRLAKLFGTDTAKNFAWLNIAGSLAQLGFDDRSRGILRSFDHPEYGFVFTSEDPDADILIVEVMTYYGVPTGLQWHILAMGYEVHKQAFEDAKRATNPTLAYRLGCLAAFGPLQPVEGSDDLMEHSGDVADKEWKEDFYLWVEDLKATTGRFESSEGEIMSTGVVASRDGEPAIDFEWTPTD